MPMSLPFEVVGQRRARGSGEEDGPLRLAFALHPHQAGTVGAPQLFRRRRHHLVQVQAHDLLPVQAGREEHEDERAIAPGSAVCPQRYRPAGLAPVAALVEALEPIAEILQALHLRRAQGARLQRAQAQRADTFGRIASGEQVRRLDGDPGGEGRERGIWLFMVAGASPCARRAACQATTSRRRQAESRSWPYRSRKKAVNRRGCRVILAVTAADRTPATASAR
ncbi:MAG TPA: hypothetical protein VNL35_08640 [Chloroflexota bacterium]|nr:hypothetical protein [Chloroflexota bacterium]